ncbi:MAG: hypothetical protein ACTSRG_09690 [Candidatus Helarchaeota archaeon]
MIKKRFIYGLILIGFVISSAGVINLLNSSLNRKSFEIFPLLSLNDYNINSNWWLSSGNPIARGNSNKTNVQITASGLGAIIVWQDNKSGNWDIYASSIDIDGFTERVDYLLFDFRWKTNGIPICTANDDQINPQLVFDGYGGAFITWQDNRSGNWDIYAQSITKQGKVVWTQNGIPLCNAGGDQINPKIIFSNFGAIIGWVDNRPGSNSKDIYAQRINTQGQMDWNANGTVICNETGDQTNIQMVMDIDNGAVITWEDLRGADSDIYAQKINILGFTQWTDNGTIVCNSTGDQQNQQLISDGLGSVIIVWEDYRNTNSDIYAQKLNQTGDRKLGSNGTAISNNTNDQRNPKLSPDGLNGAIITWLDNRTTGNGADIYGQRINSTGITQWTLNGTVIVNSTANQREQEMVPRDIGVIMVWSDNRTGSYGIYCQLVDRSGKSYYSGFGTTISSQINDQTSPKLCTDSRNGAYITWIDTRSGIDNIYAQRIANDGRVAPLNIFISKQVDTTPNIPLIITIALVFGIPLCSVFTYCLLQMRPKQTEERPQVSKKREHPRRRT